MGKHSVLVGSREVLKGDSSHPGRSSVGGVNHPPSEPASLQSQHGFTGRLEITLQVAGQHTGVSTGTGDLFTSFPNG